MFRLIKILNARGCAAECTRMPATASTHYKHGEALVLSSGKLVCAAATDVPTYIAAEDYEAPATGARDVYCYPVSPAMLFSVPLSVTPTALAPGDAVTLASDGLRVTATKTNGHATIVSLCGATASGDEITVTLG